MFKYPITHEEAATLTYGQFMSKRRYDPKCCAFRVWSPGRGSMDSQCSRKPGHGPGELYCKQHAEAVAPTKPPKPPKKSYLDLLYDNNKVLEERVRVLEAAIRLHRAACMADYAMPDGVAAVPGGEDYDRALWSALE